MPLSILMLTADRQVDRRILQEAQSLREAGHTVQIVARATPHTHGDAAQHILRTGSAGALHAGYGLYRRALPLQGWLYRAARALGTCLKSPSKVYAREFLPLLRRMKADCYMAHDLPMLPLAVWAAQHHGGRVLYDSHELFTGRDISALERKRWAKLEGALIGQCAAVLTINPSIAQEMAARYPGVQPIVLQNADLLPEPLPMPGRYFHQLYELEADTRVGLFQGGLTAGRNLRTLVQAMAELRDEKLALVLMGEGAEAVRLAALVKKLGLHAQVKLHPRVPQHELLTRTADADFGIIPYQPTCLNNQLCSPNKLYEFIVAGLPVLGSDLPEIRRLVAVEDIGLVADLSTPARMADALRHMARAPFDGWRARVQQLRHRVNWQQESRALVAAVNSLADAQVG